MIAVSSHTRVQARWVHTCCSSHIGAGRQPQSSAVAHHHLLGKAAAAGHRTHLSRPITRLS